MGNLCKQCVVQLKSAIITHSGGPQAPPLNKNYQSNSFFAIATTEAIQYNHRETILQVLLSI